MKPARRPGPSPARALVVRILPSWAKRAAARPIRWALVRYARARPRPAAAAREEPRLIFLLTTAWGMGGTIRTTLNLADYLARFYQVEIISISRTRDRPFFGEFPTGVEVIDLDDRRPKVRSMRRHLTSRILGRLPSALMHPRDRAALGFNLWIDLQLVRRLRRGAGILIGTRPGFNLLLGELALPGFIAVGQEHMHLLHHPAELRAAMPKLYPRLAALTVLTRPDLDAYERFLNGSVRVARIPNSVRELDGPDADLDARVLLAAGRLTPQKGYDLLLPAFAQVAARHPDWRLRICGVGPLRDELASMITELGLERCVELRGPARNLAGEVARASVFVLSSRFEGFPLVLLEAMSKRMAVVSFDCPTGPADVIDHRRNGILVPAEDVDALAGGTVELIEDPDLRRSCAAAAVETARGYTIDAIGPRWQALLDDLRGAEGGSLTER
jgi:glycosyltransferase involved in cell wall biosynthesis